MMPATVPESPYPLFYKKRFDVLKTLLYLYVMIIDYENPSVINVHKQWFGKTEDGKNFIIDGGYNDFDGYYVDSVEFEDVVEDEDVLTEKITTVFLNEVNS